METGAGAFDADFETTGDDSYDGLYEFFTWRMAGGREYLKKEEEMKPDDFWAPVSISAALPKKTTPAQGARRKPFKRSG